MPPDSTLGNANVILTGFMACGKTTVGTLLAARLHYRFVDTDQLIEQRCGMTIAELFRRRGEPFFALWRRRSPGKLATRRNSLSPPEVE
jgi:shikimate kinase